MTCSTWVRPSGDRTWSIGTYIEAASQALEGDRYRGWDGDLTPDFVTPAYRVRRSLQWETFRGGPVEHEALRTVRGPDGTELPVYGVSARMADGKSTERWLAVMVNGWIVVQRLSAPTDSDKAAQAMAMAQLQRLVATIDRPRPDAAAVHARVEALRLAEATPPAGADDPTAVRIQEAFEAGCVRPAIAGQSYEAAIAGLAGWTAAEAPPGLPNIMRDPAPRVWLVPGEGPKVYVHLNAAMNGDCAVSAYGADAAVSGPALAYRLTQGPEARFATGFRSTLRTGIVSTGLDGKGWAADGSMIVNATQDPGRPSIFVGARAARRR